MPDFNRTPPEIDYLTKDFASFRRLMLDHLSQLVPDWKEQSPADLGHALVEVLAYAADYLSYYQDAVATEAYLGTARLRRSVRRHVRLLEYYLQEGCNARAWVQIQVDDQVKEKSPPYVFLPVHTQLLTRLFNCDTCTLKADEVAYHQALEEGATVFETMHHITLRPDHNEIPILPRKKEDTLSRGSTTARLAYKWKHDKISANLKAGDVLIFEEQYDLQTGLANPDHRHAVRLTRVTPGESQNSAWLDVEWALADALPFDLVIATSIAGHPKYKPGVALGNIVLADHGRRIRNEMLPPVQPGRRYRPRLRFTNPTFAAPFDSHAARKRPAFQTMQYQPYEAFACVQLHQYAQYFAEQGKENVQPRLLPDLVKDTLTIPAADADMQVMMMGYNWTLRRDLLNSGPFDRDFQVEMEDGRQAYLRFGFGDMGKLPDPGDRFVATYRIGNGSRGNVGADTIAHVIEPVGSIQPLEDLIKCVRNPISARGGCDPENIQSARLYAPCAFHTQKACVTPADYARQICQHPAVVHAMAHTSRVGNRRMVMLYVQRAGDLALDSAFQQELKAFIEPYRLMGCDIEIKNPRYVPLQIKLGIHLKPGASTLIVQRALSQAFSQEILPGGDIGFFYPHRFDFGQSVYQSQVIAHAMAVPGVEWVEVQQFRRVDSHTDVTEIIIEPREIARLKRINFDIEGGV